MKDITKIEETVLLTIWRLQDNAYGVTIKNQIKKVPQREYLYSTLYTTLEQLVTKGLVAKRFGDSTPERGGKRKIFFNLTKNGLLSLKNAYVKQKAVWQGVTEESFNFGILNE